MKKLGTFEDYLGKAQSGITPKRRTQKEYWESMEGLSSDPMIPSEEVAPEGDSYSAHAQKVAELLFQDAPDQLGGGVLGFNINIQAQLTFGWANGPIGVDLYTIDGHQIASEEASPDVVTPEQEVEFIQAMTKKYTGGTFQEALDDERSAGYR